MKVAIFFAGVLGMSGMALPVSAGNGKILLSFPGESGPGYKSCPNTTGAIGPHEIAEETEVDNWAGGQKSALQFPGMIAGRVEDSKNNHRIAFDAEENLVRKSLSQCPAKSPIINGKSPGIVLYPNEGICNGDQELIAQTKPPLFIPVARFP
jgi:hypothetical protein